MKRNGNTRERIMEAARNLIWKHGYSHVTVDAICDEIDIQKGSFYHFFENKATLAVAAFGALWDYYKPLLDRSFSTNVPPLKRLQNYLRFLYETQLELQQKYGRVMGCPFCLLAAELTQHDKVVALKAREALNAYPKYLETALRDAQAEGSVAIKNVPATVRRLCAFVDGCLQQARIQNNLALLRDLTPGVLDLMGIETLAGHEHRRKNRITNLKDLERLALAG